MFTKMIVATALLLTAGAAFASDASYDQRQIREGNVTSVEGGPRALPVKKAVTGDKAPSTPKHPMVACSCGK